MPWDYEETVRIDAEDILDYVKDNKQWFLDRLGSSEKAVKNEVADLGVFVDSVIDKYNKIRILRDASTNNADDPRVKIYEDLVDIRKTIDGILK